MEITATKERDISIFHIKGRLDSNSSEGFEQTVFGAIENGANQVLIDFSDLDYISSAGLRVILKATKGLKNASGKLVLCSLQDYVKEVFEISGFDTLLPIAPSQKEAMATFE